MVQDTQATWGKWVKATRYEIKEGVIQPAGGADFVEYDPWRDFRLGPEQPYEALLDLLRTLRRMEGPEAKGASTHKAVVSWCNDHGLLGILPHRLLVAHLQPRYEPLDLGVVVVDGHRDLSVLAPTQPRIIRSAGGWRISAKYQAMGERSVVIVDEPERAGTLVEPEHLPVGWPTPGAILRSLSGNDVKQVGLDGEWASYFPGLDPAEHATFSYPRPSALEFHRIYGEPLDEFLDTARQFESTLQGLAKAGPPKDLDAETLREVVQAHSLLNALVMPITPAVRLEDDGTIRQIWVSPSLLASYSMMAVHALGTPGWRVGQCVICAKPFVTSRSRTEYCGETCRRTGQKRKQRARRRVGGTE